MRVSSLCGLLRYGRPHVRVLVAAFGCMVVLGLATGAYAYLMGPALRFLLSGGSEGFGGAQRGALAVGLPREAAIWGFPVVVLGVGLLKGVGSLGPVLFMGLFAQNVVADLRRDLFLRLTSLSPAQLSRERHRHRNPHSTVTPSTPYPRRRSRRAAHRLAERECSRPVN